MTLQDAARPAGPNTILGVVLTAYLMILLDLSIVYTGMPEIGKTMGMSPVMPDLGSECLPALLRRVSSPFR